MNTTLNYILESYLSAKTQPFFSHPVQKCIEHDSIDSIVSQANVNLRKYEIIGFAGSENWAETPRIALLYKDLTDTAMRGYEIVYLFRADMSGVYLSLNQSWTSFKHIYGTKNGKEKFKSAAEGWRKALSSILTDFSFEEIDLRTDLIFGKCFELGHICGKFYPANSLPSNAELVKDLHNLMIALLVIECNVKLQPKKNEI